MNNRFFGNLFLMTVVAFFLASCAGSIGAGRGLKPTPDAQRNPDLPVFETSAAQLQQSFDRVKSESDKKLAQIAALDMKALTFDNTVKALEEIFDQMTLARERNDLLKDVHPDKDLRDKAYDLSEEYENWFTDAQARGDIYKVLKAFSDANPNLNIEERRLLDTWKRDYERAGFSDQGIIDENILSKKKAIAELKTQISKRIVEANAEKVVFTEQELEGLLASQLEQMEKIEKGYVVNAGDRAILRNVIMTFSPREETRKKAFVVYNSRARDNLASITNLITARLELGKLLGYDSWSDYQTKIKMAKTGQTAYAFLENVSTLLKPKFEKELGALFKYIEIGVNADDHNIDAWDVYYFQRLYEQDSLKVDYEDLRKYFKYYNVVNGMFHIFEEVLDLKIDFIEDPYKWHDDVQLAVISDAVEQKVLGYLYLDMFPRLDEGKMQHFATYSVISGKRLGTGEYRKPVNVLVCNFEVNSDGSPKPMLWRDIRTLFHEFGHALHCILSKSSYASLTGFNVPQDFVEVPSQIFENWITDKNVFKRLAIDHEDITDAFVKETIDKIKNANLATIGLFYERQFAFGLMDLAIHGFTDTSQIPPASDEKNNLIAVTNKILGDTYLAYPDESSMITSFNHVLVWGYDAGYYGYAWADSIVAEFLELFERSPFGFMDRELGDRLRREIFEPGNSREVTESVEAFLGEELDPERKAFLKRLGIN